MTAGPDQDSLLTSKMHTDVLTRQTETIDGEEDLLDSNGMDKEQMVFRLDSNKKNKR